MKLMIGYFIKCFNNWRCLGEASKSLLKRSVVSQLCKHCIKLHFSTLKTVCFHWDWLILQLICHWPIFYCSIPVVAVLTSLCSKWFFYLYKNYDHPQSLIQSIMEPIIFYYEQVDRHAIVVKPKQPLLNWINALYPDMGSVRKVVGKVIKHRY